MIANRRIALTGLAAASLALLTTKSKKAHAVASGIDALIAVTQQKAQNANDAALAAANGQRELLKSIPLSPTRQRELVVLQQYEANYRAHAEILADIKLLRAEASKLPCK